MYKRTHSLQIAEGGAFNILNIFTMEYHSSSKQFFPLFQPSHPPPGGGL